MADDNLRIVARVEDAFSGPLKKLKSELEGVGAEAKKQGSQWRKDWSGLTEDMGKFKGVLGGVEPILSKIGMGGFGAALSLGGMTAALKSFSGNTRDLSLMGRQIGMTVDQLRTFGAMGEKFGVSAETMRGAIGHLADNARDLRNRWGEVYGELRNMNLGKLAEDLVNAPNMQAMAQRAMEGIQKIPDNMIAARVSTLVFGTPDVARVVRNLGTTVGDAFKSVQADIGKLDPATEEAANKFEANLARMGRAAERLKLNTLGPALKAIDRVIEGGDQNGIRGNEEAIGKDLTARRDRKQARIDFLKTHPEADPKADEKIKRLTDEVAKLNEQLRLMREGGGAYQPTAFSPGPLSGGGGSLIQKAAWGGFGGGNPDGMDGMRSRYPVPSYGAGPLNGGGGGAGGPPGGVGTPAGAAGGPISRKDMRDVNPEMADYIRRSAIAHGIDPNVALRIANSEGLRGSIPGVRNTPGDKGTSFGPFQLHYASRIPGLTLGGLGDRYTRETGHHASDPKHWKEQIDFALRVARKEGWGAWHGRYGARIGLWDGIGTVKPVPIPKEAQDESGDFPNGAPRALKPLSMADDPSVPGQVAGGKRRAAGDALMDRFYGRGAAGGGPAMQMPGDTANGKGTLHIKFENAPPGMTHRASLDGLFDGHTVSRSRPQIAPDRA